MLKTKLVSDGNNLEFYPATKEEFLLLKQILSNLHKIISNDGQIKVEEADKIISLRLLEELKANG